MSNRMTVAQLLDYLNALDNDGFGHLSVYFEDSRSGPEAVCTATFNDFGVLLGKDNPAH